MASGNESPRQKNDKSYVSGIYCYASFKYV